MTSADKEEEQSAAPAHQSRAKVLAFIRSRHSRLGLIWVSATLVICTLCIGLWSNEAWRPALAALGAGSAAFLGPLPGLLSPETRGKWIYAIAISALITAGTWFATNSLGEQVQQLSTRTTYQRTALQTLTRELPTPAQDEIFLAAAPYLRGMVRAARARNEGGIDTRPDWEAILDIALPLISVRNTNGHALYFAGEAHRHLGQRVEMRGAFQNFEAAARPRPDARIGAADACYQSPDGFCAERYAWIMHLMANDYLEESAELTGPAQTSALATALTYIIKETDIRESGFLPHDGALATCHMLQVLIEDVAVDAATRSDLIERADRFEQPCLIRTAS